ncbi:MAG: transcriptional repressor [Kiritimatiellae bacterium]|nr:transcriptional repressor [Kiritimatiellia bacterium]
MKDPRVIFKRYCVEHGLRYTRERECIIEEIFRKNDHFDADNLFLSIRNRHPEMKLAKGSIYRTLPHLIAAGLISKSLFDEGCASYEHTLGDKHHDHMRCLKCGKIFEFYNDEIDEAQRKVCEEQGFEMLWHMHVIGGYCRGCRGGE